jgi:hypothetical protein
LPPCAANLSVMESLRSAWSLIRSCCMVRRPGWHHHGVQGRFAAPDGIITACDSVGQGLSPPRMASSRRARPFRRPGWHHYGVRFGRPGPFAAPDGVIPACKTVCRPGWHHYGVQTVRPAAPDGIITACGPRVLCRNVSNPSPPRMASLRRARSGTYCRVFDAFG